VTIREAGYGHRGRDAGGRDRGRLRPDRDVAVGRLRGGPPRIVARLPESDRRLSSSGGTPLADHRADFGA